MNFANNEMTVIVSLLLRQFDLELLDKHPGVSNSLGASRPTPVRIRYRRRAAEGEPHEEMWGKGQKTKDDGVAREKLST